MNRWVAIGVASVFLAASGACAYLALAMQGNGLVAVEPTLDLGELGQEEKIQVEFRLVNKAAETVEITGVYKSCDCTDVTYEPATVMPGQTCLVKANWSTGKGRGVSLTELSIVYAKGDGEIERTDLRIKAVVKPDIEVSSKQLIFNVNEKSVRHLTLKPGRQSEFRIDRVSCSQRAFEAKVRTGTSVVEVSFDPKGWADDLSEATLLIETNSVNEPTIEVNLIVSGTRPASED